jgi:predicted membrane channel-forming protein YqfA (hemolysin III family)
LSPGVVFDPDTVVAARRDDKRRAMVLVAVAWMYVVLMMAVAEATSPQGTVLGAVFTFLLYGVLPLSILLYIMNTPARKRRRRAAEAAAAPAGSGDPDGGSHATGDAVAAERKEV